MTLAFAGDVHFEGRLEPLREDPATALAPIAPQLSAADVTVLNLEAAITERGVPEPKQFHFRVPEEMLAAFPAAGVDVLTMANNHGVDYGRDGLEDTLAAIGRSPIPIVGIGADAERAFTPAVIDVRGTQVAVIGADQHPDRTTQAWTADDDSPGVASALEPERLLAAVTAAGPTADVVVVYLHWGTDYEACPNERQRTLTEQLALAGADVVVGAHAHELQGAGWFPVDRAGEGVEGPGSVYVSYGLGNFVWWRSNSEVAITTGVLTLTLEGRTTVDARWTPMRIADTGLPVVQTGADAARRSGLLGPGAGVLGPVRERDPVTLRRCRGYRLDSLVTDSVIVHVAHRGPRSRHARGRGSVVEHHLAKVRVAGSNPVVRSEALHLEHRSRPGSRSHGGVAERRGNGLQSRLHGFKSRHHLDAPPAPRCNGRLAQW